MFNTVKQIILKTKVVNEPYPHIIVKNFFPQKIYNDLIKTLPDFNSLDDPSGKELLIQSKHVTKKTLMPDTKIFKELKKNNIFKSCDDVLKKIQPYIVQKFKDHIDENIHSKYLNNKIKYHMSLSFMRKGYLKSPHIDRRDHLIHALYYPVSEKSKSGDLLLYNTKKKPKIYDIFPRLIDLKIKKRIKVNPNFCIFSLNVPWAYHGVNKYNGNKDRKYFYVAYDFKIKNPGSKLKNRKKGFNDNSFWIVPAKVKSQSRRKKFLNE